ncbi:MAG TPA: periplasmic heavy metal sensor [Terriglobales bacterium]|nr:periplasmic heavy metal sensor [Terriglobales bacterium]
MRIKWLLVLGVFVTSLWAQGTPKTAPAPGKTVHKDVFYMRGDMGKWWQNQEIANKLQLNGSQIAELDQSFLDHKLKLIDYGAEAEKQDLKLQSLLDADVPNEGQIQSQIDQVLNARGKLEREVTLMNLDLRKVLSLDQWRQLKAIRGDVGMMGHKILFMQKGMGPGVGVRTVGPGGPPPDDLPPLPPGPGGEDID